MLSEINSGHHGLVAAQANAAPSAGEVVQRASADAPKVQAIPKVDIKVNTEQMRQNLQEAINKLNELVRDGGRGLNFAMDEKLGRPIVSVKNSDTGELIRQIPTEEVVRVAHSIENIKGLLHKSLV